ncbi:DUF4260 domain-containing protein [Chryseobacterium sp. L7]|uniref:DUF4260 domain-containing protein n=1 Tax=Chryseobacterium endalhagicum TaxID=2797638 RepID=A0ABS1QM23_9FLAO|nr:DUF4260 domain-containing protein [Chryseobacterium endalhagicum]MBL1222943.1 DUF4260 domain-containing protein [Chryseobacterium endalhagicum]
MKIQLQLEYLAFIVLGIFAFAQTGISWWWFAGLFFAPDLSMLGYLINTKTGAFFYNLFHHLGLAIVLYLAGTALSLPYLQMAGAIMFAHSSFDRLLGYGLKYPDSFQNTHLGKIGKKALNL